MPLFQSLQEKLNPKTSPGSSPKKTLLIFNCDLNKNLQVAIQCEVTNYNKVRSNFKMFLNMLNINFIILEIASMILGKRESVSFQSNDNLP